MLRAAVSSGAAVSWPHGMHLLGRSAGAAGKHRKPVRPHAVLVLDVRPPVTVLMSVMKSTLAPSRIRHRARVDGPLPDDTVFVGRRTKWDTCFRYRTPSGLVRYRPADPDTYEYEGRISAHGTRHDVHHADGTYTVFRVRYASRAELAELYRRTILDPDPGMVGAYPSNRGHLITFRDPSDQRLRTVTADLIRDELAGKNLACACPADVPCHADALLAIANGELP